MWGHERFPESIATTTCTTTGASFTITNTPVGGNTDILQNKREGAMRKLLLLFLALSLSATVEARPRWRTLGRIALYGAAIASTVESAHQTNLCRDRTEISRCNGGYGEVGARQVANGVFTGGMIVLSEWGHHKHYKEWALPVTAVTTYNGVTAFQQSRIQQARVHERKLISVSILILLAAIGLSAQTPPTFTAGSINDCTTSPPTLDSLGQACSG